MPSKYQALLKDDDVGRWYENLAAKSVVTAGVYLRGLGLFCALNGTTPARIVKEAKTKQFRDGFTDFVRRLERQGKAGSYIARFKKVLVSWASYNGVELKLRVNIAGEFSTPTLADERIPTKEELSRILRTATGRGRVSTSLMAFCGLRPESLGDYEGKDGLRLGDLPEMKIEGGRVGFAVVPTLLNIRSNLSKARHQYFTFVPQEALTYLAEHLEGRMERGEALDGRTPLLGLDPRGSKRKLGESPFLRTTLVTRDVKEAIKGAGFAWRPYVLRAHTATAFDIAESRALISHPWRQFFMGHKGDIEARYSTNKGRLPPEMVEEMRSAYTRCEPLLSSSAQPVDQMAIVKEAKIETLKLVAKSMFGLDLLEAKVARERETGAELTPDETLELFEKEMERRREQPDPQIMVDEGDLEGHLRDGWEYVATLPSGKILVRK